MPRSSFYAASQPKLQSAVPRPAAPRPEAGDPDDALLAAIKEDLARPPWTGEGRRKVWASLRVHDSIHVSRKRLLHLMREHAVLSPYRPRRIRDDSHLARFWGISPSYAFVAGPETHGVIERLFRTLKEQAIHGQHIGG